MQVIEGIAHLFIPRHTNNHKAKILHSPVLVTISGIFAVYLLIINLYVPKTFTGVLGYAANISVSDVVTLTNVKRSENGLAPLSVNPQLTEAARKKGEDMLARDYWAHVAPDGTQPWKFFADVGYKYRFAGENLAKDFTNPGSAIDAWMASPSHRDNMLSDKYKEIGIAVVEGDMNGVDTTIIVQLFGSTSEAVAQVSESAVAKEIVKPTTIATPAPSTVPAVAALYNQTPIPSVAPVVTLTPSPIFYTPPAPVAAFETVNPEAEVLISPFTTTKNMSFVVIGILLAVLVVDVIVVSRRRISRIGGRSIAHIAFLGVILAIAIILNAGRII